jgi:glycosyltransferase involved in cell wall biosynthesis
MNKKNILVIAPYCDGTDVGEAWSTYQWIDGLKNHFDITLLTMRKHNHPSVASQMSGINIIEWQDLPWVNHWDRFNSMTKPGYIKFYWNARRWIHKAIRSGSRFDLIHQLCPLAMRYPSPGVGFQVPLIVGPIAGSLPTPKPFLSEYHSVPWYRQLRNLDALRFQYDPMLRNTYANADLILGVAPYVEKHLSSIPYKKFSICSETGFHAVKPIEAKVRNSGDPLHLLYVGRVIRSKGLRDTIRALSQVDKNLDITLDVLGEGEDLNECKREVVELNLNSKVAFHGRVPRAEVERFYESSDAFIFPSFQEPSGNVIFESMSHGLPVITTKIGGPGYVVSKDSGIRLPVLTPSQLATDISFSIENLYHNTGLYNRFSSGALNRIKTIGLWDKKIDWMSKTYQEIFRMN